MSNENVAGQDLPDWKRAIRKGRPSFAHVNPSGGVEVDGKKLFATRHAIETVRAIQSIRPVPQKS